MITECNESNVQQVFDYIGNDYEKCLYMYIDLVKYGLENENFNVWIQYNDEENICCLISKYYSGMLIYSRDYDLISDELKEFLVQNDPDVVSGMKESMYKIKDGFSEYHETIGFVGKLEELTYTPNPNCYSASDDEIEEIARLVAQDENIGMHYGFDSIYKQFKDRREDNFGRNCIERDGDTNEIICHVATSAELPELAVIGSVITAPKYRGKGYSKKNLAALCNQLMLEDKRVFSYFNFPPSVRMHLGVGFEKIGEWVKFKKTN